jgi:NTP pyrophosphatase (non-canonical NTP hydrolase)
MSVDGELRNDMAVETSATIAEWAETTFGPVDSLDVIVRRAQQEITELRDALARNASPAEIAHEAADITIFLHRLVALVGHDLNAAVDEKMSINRQRRWQLSGDGVGQHI